MTDKDLTVVDFTTALEERYLSYALSTIMSRSLPDVRDGLKPVHRRILYSMSLLKLEPQHAYKKCARIVGDVIGKFHPHGDAAIYSTLVRLAQSFSVRYPLIDGQGNFGSVDGDSAAAMRYTESKLTRISMELLKDIDQDTVDFRDTYDGQDKEPVLLPATFPNLLANGSEGIAVGMATNIPPHNLDEICDAIHYLIENPECSIKYLLKFIKGPDFPTGATIIETKDEILKAYSTGKGSFRIRSKWKKEDLTRGQYRIIVTEIPYQVSKSRLIEKLVDSFKNKKLPLLGDIRDESAEDIRIILEPKTRDVNPELLMESIFRVTDFETKFSMNLNALNSNAVPKVMNLKEVLQEFLQFRQNIILRRSKYKIAKVENRLEVLDGFLIVYLNLDEVIRIIRTEDDPKKALSAKFMLTEIQVEAILNIKLRSLRKLEEQAIKKEYTNLKQEQKALKALIASESLRWNAISEETNYIKETYGKNTILGKRRTKIINEMLNNDLNKVEAFIEKENITISCSNMGWIKSIKNHVEPQSIKYKDGDKEKFVIHSSTTDKLLAFASDGKVFTIACDKIPRTKGDGNSIKFMVDIDTSSIVDLIVFEPNTKFILASASGKGFIVKSDDLIAQTKTGKQVMNLDTKDSMKIALQVTSDKVSVLSSNKKILSFSVSEIPEMKKGKGVILQKYKDGSKLRFIKFLEENSASYQNIGGTRISTETLQKSEGKRAGVGVTSK
ncbi:MAG: DNA topoisomerase IV subunit A [Alphaproteobacteria bacterium]|nr:DNA topoisomerase IV subunit A [Alphaproteobacteria bacterium]